MRLAFHSLGETLCWVLLVAMPLFVIQIQYAGAHVTGDAGIFLFNVLRNIHFGLSTNTKLPFFAQHYDELMYLYPIYYGFRSIAKLNLMLPLWILGSMGKIASFSLIFICLKTFIKKSHIVFLITYFVFHGNLFINPFYSTTIFDSGNPIVLCMHIGRLIGICLPVFMFTLAYKLNDVDKSEHEKLIYIFCILFGVGISSTTISNSYITFLLYLASVLFTFRRISNEGEKIYGNYKYVSFLMFLIPTLVYASMSISSNIIAPAFMVLGLFTISILFILHFLDIDRLKKINFQLFYDCFFKKNILFPMVIGIVFGNLFLGNIALSSVARVLNTFPGNDRSSSIIFKSNDIYLPSYEQYLFNLPIVKRNIVKEDISKKHLFSTSKVYHNNRMSSYVDHCRNLLYFARKFGLPVIIGIVSMLIIGLVEDSKKVKAILMDRQIASCIWYSFIFMLLGFLLYDFILNNDDFLSTWLKSRLVEPWFYSTIIMGLILIFRFSNKILSSSICILICIWIAIPIFSQNEYKQYTLNAKYFFDRVIKQDYTYFVNHDFENGNLDGWNVIDGHAFNVKDVVAISRFSKGTAYFQNQGLYHLWSFFDGGDNDTGEIRTQEFVLGGDGVIDFLISGGNDIENLYAMLNCEGKDYTEFKTTGQNSEVYRKVTWHAEKMVGKKCFIRIVDNKIGPWGHINIDDVNAPVAIQRVK